jgi:SMC interacting uncharacterized protein involved in chromosome segregation
MSKPYSNSKLKTLPEEVQARVAGWCAKGSLSAAVSRCSSELSLATNLDSMSKFFRWWKTEQDKRARIETIEQLFQRADANAKAVGELLAQSGATPEQIAAADQMVFTLEASSSPDKSLWIELEKLRVVKEAAAQKARSDAAKIRQKDRDLSLVERRVTLLEENAQKAKDALTKVVKKGGLSPEDIAEIEAAAKLL